MGLCLDGSAFCNGSVECPDGSDEKPGCENGTFVYSFFTLYGYF